MSSNSFRKTVIEIISVIVIAVGLIVFLHFKNNQHSQSDNNSSFSNKLVQPFAYVQLGDHPWLLNVQKEFEPIANEIITQQILLHNSKAVNIPTFYLKKRNIITLLYCNSYPESLYESIIQTVQTSVPGLKDNVSKIHFSHHVAWFGQNQSELVITIRDSDHVLLNMRENLKSALKNTKLYDQLGIEEINKFDYVPHETIGRINLEALEKLSSKERVEKIKDKLLESFKKLVEPDSKPRGIIPNIVELYGNDFKVIASFDLSKN